MPFVIRTSQKFWIPGPEPNSGFRAIDVYKRQVQGYLLDRYLFRKLKSVRCFSYSEIVEQGEEAGERLRKLCRQAVYGEEPEKIQYAQTVHTYIEKHPSSYAEKHTNEEMYTAELAHLYLEQAAPRFYQELEDDLLCQCNLNDGIELYNRIVQLLGEERAVSYTHLDVYKRQVRNTAKGRWSSANSRSSFT